MNLRRQLLLVSLLTLVLPWAGCQFIRETESALREGQQQMLSGTALAIADSLSQFPDEFSASTTSHQFGENQLYGHPLDSAPLIDGYFDDWSISPDSMNTMRGIDGPVRFAIGIRGQHAFLFVDVRDDNIIYASVDIAAGSRAVAAYSDRIVLATGNGSDLTSLFQFAAEAPGALVATNREGGQRYPEPRILAQWQDTASGYRLEARLPQHLLDSHLGIVVTNTDSSDDSGIRSSSFGGRLPGRFVTSSLLLQSVVAGYVQPGLRLIVTDRSGWRLAQAGDISLSRQDIAAIEPSSRWMQIAYTRLLEPGKEAPLAEPHPSGREQQNYVAEALNATQATSWFRSRADGRAVVAVAQPVWSGNVQTGVVILQQGTDAILSLTNQALTRLMNFTLIATLAAAAALLGYSSWLSLRIRRLSSAAESALDGDKVLVELPSALAKDEIGDLSRGFASVLQQLGGYNEYLRSLATKLSHELRTPLTIVTSSLENLEHESLTDEAAEYTARAKDGATRLRKILNAMSEANKVEELMENAELERFNLHEALASTVAAYGDAYSSRRFSFRSESIDMEIEGAPELIIQMLDKLVDNAVEFSATGDQIDISLGSDTKEAVVTVSNPGPPLPEKMRIQLFDSLVSVRDRNRDEHLGLGLYIARLIAEGHRGSISADNIDGGVAFEIRLPAAMNPRHKGEDHGKRGLSRTDRRIV
jgi:dedicated sortase system histidine kinase